MPTCWCCRDDRRARAVAAPRAAERCPLAIAAGTLAVLVWQVGTGPFLDGLRTVDGGALAAAFGLAVLTTVCCAWRWRVVARGLGVELPLGTAVAAYYRSLFLNVTLPGGVVGDVHRGISHGRDTSDVGRGLRAVAWERSAGQVVQVVLTVAVLLVVPSPVRGGDAARRARRPRAAAASPWCWWARAPRWRAAPGARAAQRAARAARVAGRRARVGARRRGPHGHVPDRRAHRRGDRAGVADAAAGAARAAAAALPNIGGWGPREGVTAWAFAAAGLGASLGVATAVVVRRDGVRRQPAGRASSCGWVTSWVRRMSDRPYTMLSCSVSLDGYLGDRTPRLALSNDADFDRVDEVRASCDAIMVGAVTVRTDNPRLLVRSPARRDERKARGLAVVADEDHGDRPRGPRRAVELLHHRRGREARLHLEPARARRPRSGSGRWRRSWTAAGACGCAGSARTSPTAASSG